MHFYHYTLLVLSDQISSPLFFNVKGLYLIQSRIVLHLKKRKSFGYIDESGSVIEERPCCSTHNQDVLWHRQCSKFVSTNREVSVLFVSTCCLFESFSSTFQMQHKKFCSFSSHIVVAATPSNSRSPIRFRTAVRNARTLILFCCGIKRSRPLQL